MQKQSNKKIFLFGMIDLIPHEKLKIHLLCATGFRWGLDVIISKITMPPY
jgi:hypothetical protein